MCYCTPEIRTPICAHCTETLYERLCHAQRHRSDDIADHCEAARRAGKAEGKAEAFKKAAELAEAEALTELENGKSARNVAIKDACENAACGLRSFARKLLARAEEVEK